MLLLKSVLNLLSDVQLHSEKEVRDFLTLSNCLIPGVLKQILEHNIFLEKIKNKDNRDPNVLELLDKKLIFNELGHVNSLLNRLEILREINSTNTYLLEKEPTSETIAVFAEWQTAGRGQFNRHWLSSALGENIALSILYSLPKKPDQLAGLSLVMGIAVANALQEYGLNEVKLKWPNDIVYDNKKLAGILIEIKNASQPGFFSIVIGVGLNLYHPITNSTVIKQAASDIYSIQKIPPQRNRLAGLLLKNCLLALSKFQSKGFSAFAETWKKLDNLKNKVVRIKTVKALQEGIVRGVNAFGQICIEINGKEHCFSTGEVHILYNPQLENC